MTLYLLSFNNYYNRIVKESDDHISFYSDYVIETIEGVTNFNPRDGVRAEQIINYDGIRNPDYVVVTEDGDNTVSSRWFVIESDRIRLGQYKMQLLRDVLTDWHYSVSTADVFIEKGSLTADSPFIYNSENMNFNEIKTREFLLKDKTKCPWVVAYVAKNVPSDQLSGNVAIRPSGGIELGTSLDQWEFYKYINTLDGVIRTEAPNLYNPPSSITWRYHNASYNGRPVILSTIGDTTYYEYGAVGSGGTTKNPLFSKSTEYLNKITNSFKATGYSTLELGLPAYTTNVLSTSSSETLWSFNNKKIVTSDGQVYQVYVSIESSEEINFKIPQASSLGLKLTNIYRNSGAFTYFYNSYEYDVDLSCVKLHLSLERVYSDEYTYTLEASRIRCADAPYDIIACPLGYVQVKDADGQLLTITNPTSTIPIARSLQREGQTFLYDLQLLPYCPVQELITEEGDIQVTTRDQYTPVIHSVDDSEEIVNMLFHVQQSTFSFNIYDVPLKVPEEAINRKILNQCHKYRLCSPNYANYFDFNLIKNGSVTYFEVDCTYKPYTPYIHVAPQFGKLYGMDFNDPRGLICGGDMSLSQIIDQWQTYEINNKNYQLSFDRQIQNMEVQHDVSRTLEAVNLVTGTMQGAVAGAGTGMLMGGGAGAAIGGVTGGMASFAGGIADITLNEKLRDEAKDFTKDMFNYNLQNIKALPLTLSKVSAFTLNNKIYPVLEHYTCTLEEQIAFANKLAFNGFTIGVIGHIDDYIQPWSWKGIESKNYIKGQVIKIDVQDDFHIANQIASELYKGVYYERTSINQ